MNQRGKRTAASAVYLNNALQPPTYSAGFVVVSQNAESGKRDYSRPLLSEPDVMVSSHPAQAWNNAPGCACGSPFTGRGFDTVSPLA